MVEEAAAGWLKQIFDLPEETSVGFVTGTQMAHMTRLAAARHALLRDRGWDVERKAVWRSADPHPGQRGSAHSSVTAPCASLAWVRRDRLRRWITGAGWPRTL